MACLSEYKVTLAAFVCLFSAVHYQMFPQIACLRRWIIILIALVWLFITACYKMHLEMACLRERKITLVAFVWLFSAVCVQMSPQSCCIRGRKVTLVTFALLQCAFSNVSSKRLKKRRQSYTACIVRFPSVCSNCVHFWIYSHIVRISLTPFLGLFFHCQMSF